jgi:hypothetical protein
MKFLSSSLPIVVLANAVRPAEALFFEALGQLACLISYSFLPFDLADRDNFPIFFKDDSVFKLAQAGEYYGVDSITEYVGFVYNVSEFQSLPFSICPKEPTNHQFSH